MKVILKRAIVIIAGLTGIIIASFKLSPYPSVWIIRHQFNKEANRANKALESFVPPKIEAIMNVQYDKTDKDAYLDAYFPTDSIKSGKRLPVIVWTHGGGLISGSKEQLSNYCKILAGRGYLVIAIDYSIAPKAKYPTPVQQLNNALAYISANPEMFNADTSAFVLAGDSGGSMLSAAAANTITSPAYAEITKLKPGLHPGQLRGLVLYCGIYETDNLKTEGAFGSFLTTVMWAYFGKKSIADDPYAKTASVTNFLTSAFPPTFISAGNKDPLLNQSKLLAAKLSALNIPLDTLFYPEDHPIALGHEYQFTLDETGKHALEKSIAFIDAITDKNHR